MNDLGPQRFSPKSVAQVNAECKQVAAEIEAATVIKTHRRLLAKKLIELRARRLDALSEAGFEELADWLGREISEVRRIAAIIAPKRSE